MLNIWGIVSIAVFYLLILGIGLWASRKAKKQAKHGGDAEENMIVAGRNLNLCMSLFSMLATAVCGAYLTGIAEMISAHSTNGGLLWCLIPFGTFGGILCGVLVAKPLRDGKYLTMIEPFERHYGRVVGVMFTVFSIFAELMWTAGVLFAFGATISVVIDTDNTVAIIVSSCIVIAYTLLGGLYAVAYTDVVQIVCVFVGIWACVPFAMTHPSVKDIGSTAHFMNNSWTNSTRGWIGELPTTDIGLWIDQLLMVILGGIPWSSCAQRLLACRNSRQAQVVSIVAGVGFMLFSIPSILIGAIAASTAWEETEYNRTFTAQDASRALPLVLQYLTPTAVAFIGLGAVSAAVMSSADSSILACGSLFSQNIYKSVIRRSPSKKEILWVMRISMVLLGIAATAAAIFATGVYAMYLLATQLAYVLLFPQLVFVLQCPKHLNRFGCIAAIVSGLTLHVLLGDPLFGIPAVIKLPFYDEERGIQLFPKQTICMLTNLVVLPVASIVSKLVMHHIFGRKSVDAQSNTSTDKNPSKDTAPECNDKLLMRDLN